jgi:hypothetical protein
MAITRRDCVLGALGAFAPAALGQPATPAGGWIPLFDGKSLKGWRVTPFNGAGEVRVDGGTIRLGKGRMTGITWTGDFPRSGYEIRFEGARLQGKDFFASIVFPVGDTHCSWINGGWDGTVVGLSSLDGNDASENDTSTMRDFVEGRWYAFRLEVSDTRIRASIDGTIVIDVDITGHSVGLRFDDTDLCKPLGLLSYGTLCGLRKVECRRLSARI